MKLSKRRQKELAAQYLQRSVTQRNQAPATSISEGNLVAYFDGCCEPKNPGGNMGMGAVLRCNGKELFSYSHFVKAKSSNTNNVAEYMAFEAILDFILKSKYEKRSFTIYGDSKLVIEQMFGTWNMKGGLYIPYAQSCKLKIQQVRDQGNRINGIWIPRTQNNYADELSKAQLINNGIEFKIQPLYSEAAK